MTSFIRRIRIDFITKTREFNLVKKELPALRQASCISMEARRGRVCIVIEILSQAAGKILTLCMSKNCMDVSWDFAVR